MCTDIDYLPHMLMISDKEFRLLDEYDRRKSWTPSTTSSSSTSTAPTTTANPTSWIDRKLFSHLKRLFRRSPSPSQSASTASSRRPSSLGEAVITLATNEPSKPVNEEEQESKPDGNVLSSSSSDLIDKPVCPLETSTTDRSNSIDALYDYNYLLTRCLERQEHDLSEMISRSQSPVTIPHADLIIGQTRSRLVNWKAYIRLFRALDRDPQLFQQYVNQHYGCQSSVNQREQLTFSTRTTRTTFDNVLKTFLNEYVTCLACQKARTHLIKSAGLWRIDCQLCGSQRSVKRLRWNRQPIHS